MIIGSGTRERTYDRDGRTWTRFEAWVEYEHEEGEPRRRRRSDHETVREAEAWIRVRIAEDATDPAAAQDHGRVKVGTLLDDYLEHGETVAGWSPSHAANTKRLVARYLAPLRNRQARHLEDVDALMARMVREKVSPHSIRQTRNALRAAFNRAIRRRRLPQGMNPAALVDVPSTTRRAPSFVPPDQIAAFIAAVEDDWLGAMYLSCAMLALRPSEAIALRWGDVDFDAGTVAIERSVHRVPGRRVKGRSTRDSGGEAAAPGRRSTAPRPNRRMLRSETAPGSSDRTYPQARGERNRTADATGARLSGFDGDLGSVLANGLPTGSAIVEIQPGDVGFNARGCGQWAKVE